MPLAPPRYRELLVWIRSPAAKLGRFELTRSDAEALASYTESLRLCAHITERGLLDLIVAELCRVVPGTGVNEGAIEIVRRLVDSHVAAQAGRKDPTP